MVELSVLAKWLFSCIGTDDSIQSLLLSGHMFLFGRLP